MTDLAENLLTTDQRDHSVVTDLAENPLTTDQRDHSVVTDLAENPLTTDQEDHIVMTVQRDLSVMMKKDLEEKEEMLLQSLPF